MSHTADECPAMVVTADGFSVIVSWTSVDFFQLGRLRTVLEAVESLEVSS